MRAAYYDRFGGPIRIRSLTDPAPSPRGVVVQVEASGLCRSDWHGWRGHDADIALPHVPGHELAGRVVAIGREVRRWRGGERVTVPFVGGCGVCSTCAAGDQHVCPSQFQPGFTAWGSFAEFVAIDYADTNLVPLPETLSFIGAASLGCRFATAFRAIVGQGRVQPGDFVAVFGCGGVGLSAVMIAAALGAHVIAVDIGAEALALARKVGAWETLTSDDRIAERIHDHTRGGVHLGIDALGHTDTMFASVSSLRRRGRHVQIGLMTGDAARAALPWERIVAYELEVLGSHGLQAHAYPSLLRLIEQGRIDPQTLVTRTLSLDDVPEALAAMDGFPSHGVSVVTSF